VIPREDQRISRSSLIVIVLGDNGEIFQNILRPHTRGNDKAREKVGGDSSLSLTKKDLSLQPYYYTLKLVLVIEKVHIYEYSLSVYH